MEWLNDMALFVEVVNAKGFGKAADKLGIAKSTLSVRIARLEQHIGLQLLNRTTCKVEPTEAGRLYYEKAARIVEEARLAHQQLDDMLHEPSGVLAITMPNEFAQTVVAPVLPEFCARYPQIALEFYLSPQRVDLVGEPFDVAIRTGEQPDSALISRQLARLNGGLYAAPAYLAQHGSPQTPDELAQHQCLRFQAGFRDEWRLTNGQESITLPVRGKLLSNSPGMNARLAAAGMGIAALPHVVVREYIAAGTLQHILPQWQTAEIPVYAVTATRLLPAKTQAFISFLAEKIRHWQAA